MIETASYYGFNFYGLDTCDKQGFGTKDVEYKRRLAIMIKIASTSWKTGFIIYANGCRNQCKIKPETDTDLGKCIPGLVPAPKRAFWEGGQTPSYLWRRLLGSIFGDFDSA